MVNDLFSAGITRSWLSDTVESSNCILAVAAAALGPLNLTPIISKSFLMLLGLFAVLKTSHELSCLSSLI